MMGSLANRIGATQAFIEERNMKGFPAACAVLSNSPEMYSGDPEPDTKVFVAIDFRPEDRGKVRMSVSVFGEDKTDNHTNLILLINQEQIESIAAFFGALVY